MTTVLVASAVVLGAAICLIVVDLILRPAPEAAVTRRESQVGSMPSASLPSTPTPPVAGAESAEGPPPRCVVPADWGSHIVAKGNTLFSLAERYGTDVQTLRRVNCLEDSTIFVGQRLYVPGPLALPARPTPTEADIPMVVSPGSAAVSATPSTTQHASPAEPLEEQINIVFLGTDKRPPVHTYQSPYRLGRPRSNSRTDAIIIVSVDTKNKLVRAVHIPRDLWVNIPDHGYDRINTAELWGEMAQPGSGPGVLKETIKTNLGIPIQYYFQVDFAGFIDIVNALGGVDIDVACPLPELDMEPGMRHMDGVEALVYVQRRDTSSDFDRGHRQRQMLMALWDQLLTPESITKLPQLWLAMSDSYKTDLPLDQAINLGYFGLQLKPQQIMMADIDGRHVTDWTTPEGAMVLVPRQDKLQAFFQKFYGPINTTALEKVDKTRVEILNGSQRREAEKLAAAALGRKGFKVVHTGEASRRNLKRTEIYVYKGDPAVGPQLAEQLGVPPSAVQDYTAIPEPVNFSNPADLRIVLGADYDPCWR